MESDGPSSPGSDLSSKYTKLAAEYSKLRAQFGVVKKAVLEEQVKNGDLSEALRHKDQVLRRLESEMESVQFRNHQLEKRVEILQEELENSTLKENLGRKRHQHNVKESEKVSASENLNSVMSEELQLKISENAQLHATLAEIDQNHAEKIDALQSRIRELESRLSKAHQAERAEDAKQKELIHGLKVENVDFKMKLTELEKELIDKENRITLLQVQLETVSNPSLDVLSKNSSSHHLILNGTEARVQTIEVLSLMGDTIQEFVAAMSDFHTYWEHRLKDTRHPDGRWLCESAEKLSKLLLLNVNHLKPVEDSYQQILSDALSGQVAPGRHPRLKFSSFSRAFSSYIHYVTSEVEPLVISCLQHESNSFTCSPTQQSKNCQLQTCIRNFDAHLKNISELLDDLVADREIGSDVVGNLTVAISKLHRQAVELSNVYSSKAVDENSLPTVNRQLINTNNCIVASLSNLVSTLNKLSHKLSDNFHRLSSLVEARFDEEDVGKNSPTEFNAEPVKSTEPATDIMNDGYLRLEEYRSEIGNLKHEIESLCEKLKKAEQTKEHWKLECQLLQMKQDKLKEKVSEGDQIAGEVSADVDAASIKQMFEEHLNSLVREKLEADSKAAHFYLECVALQKRLRDREKSKENAERQLIVLEDQISNLRDEMGVSSTSYEDQLNLMSEHVATMNDKLASQTDEIERLKFELKQKMKK